MIRIALDGNFDAVVSSDLAELRDKLVENGFEVTSASLTVPGLKVDLTTGLAIASLTVASLSALINVINFWKSQRPPVYRVSFESSTETSLLDDRDQRKLVEAVEAGRLTAIRIEKI